MVKMGLVGYGYWGPNILRNLFEAENCEVLYVCDKDILRLKEVRKKYPTLILTTDFNELLNDSELEAICAAVPTRFHYPIAKAALEHGKNVLVEKPFTVSYQEALKLSQLAKKNKRVLMVDHTFLFNEAVRQIKKLINEGVLGDIIYIDSTRVNLGLFQKDVNVIFDLATHDFSIIQYLLGEKPLKIQAFGKSHYNRQEDVANIITEYKNGVFANTHVSWLSPLKVRRMLLVGTKKMIVYDDLEQSEKIKIFDKGVSYEEGLTKKLEMAKISYRSGDAWLPNIKNTEALSVLVSEFIRACSGKETYLSDYNFATDIMKTVETATRSARMGKTITLDY